MRKVNYLYISSLALCGVLTLDFLWFGIFSETNSIKLLITILIINLLVFIGDLVISDSKEDKTLKDDGYLD